MKGRMRFCGSLAGYEVWFSSNGSFSAFYLIGSSQNYWPSFQGLHDCADSISELEARWHRRFVSR
jgi:hypothetical protein